ncbi:MAG TPA: hypothetical protein VIF37_01495 [Methylobacter sp.]|jgi:hypothetical protein
MNNLTHADLDQIFSLIDGLLFSVGISALILGVFIGWHFRAEYSHRQWLKHGVYCDDCAPLVCSSKDHGTNQDNNQ